MKKTNSKQTLIQKLIAIKIPGYLLVIVLFVAITGSIIIEKNSEMKPQTVVVSNGHSEPLHYQRLEGYKYTRPVLFMDREMEDQGLANIKTELENRIAEFQGKGVIKDASVYLRMMESGQFIEVNAGKRFMPGSMLKIVLLIYYLKESENYTGLLDKKLYFGKHQTGLPEQVTVFKPLPENASYTVRQLLEYMIVQSDNDATYLLRSQMNMETYNRIFHDLGIISPSEVKSDYTISPVEMSRFFRILYNSSYLSQKNSEYALTLLAKSRFEDGFRKHLDESVDMVHKFGERNTGEHRQLSECGIIYNGNSPFVLCVMADGDDEKKLPEVLQGLSYSVYTGLGVKSK